MNTITHEQREAFARLLREAKERRNKLFEHQLEEKVQEEFLPKLVQRQTSELGHCDRELTRCT